MVATDIQLLLRRGRKVANPTTGAHTQPSPLTSDMSVNITSATDRDGILFELQ